MISISDALAVTALVFALVTLILDVAFFLRAEAMMHRFVDKQNERADALNKQQLETMSKMSEVLAQVSERAKIVQEQVSTQFNKVTDFAMARASREAQTSGNEISEAMQQEIVRISSRVDEVTSGQATKETVDELRSQLLELGNQIARLPSRMEKAARRSVASAADVNSDGPGIGSPQELRLLKARFLSTLEMVAGDHGPREVSLSHVIDELLPDDRRNLLAEDGWGIMRIVQELEIDGRIRVEHAPKPVYEQSLITLLEPDPFNSAARSRRRNPSSTSKGDSIVEHPSNPRTGQSNPRGN